MAKILRTAIVLQLKLISLGLVLSLFSNQSFAQQVYCNGPWGGAGAIGDPARWTYIGQAGNAADPSTGKGAVSYEYSYFDRFVRVGDWLTFLNAVDPSGSGGYEGRLADLGLITYNGSQWVAQSWDDCSTASGQSLTASQVSKIAVSYVSFNLACRFANWVATGSVSSGAYTFASSAPNANVTSINYSFQGVRLPTENEFYKAAYYDPTSSSYNSYGATNIVAGVPVQTMVNTDATLQSQSGSPYNLPLTSPYTGNYILFASNPAGLHCLWQIEAGQGDRSAYGLFNMVGGFHHLLTINQGGTYDATAGYMMFRPGNQLEGPSGQNSGWSYPGSASDPGWTMDAHLASPSFHLVIVGNKCGGCPTIAAPVVADGSRCGTGTVGVSLTTNCTTSGSSLHIYSDVGITNDITSQFTIAGSTITTPSISSTKTYYAVCQSTTSATTCFSSSDMFTATVSTAPTATASATQPTCSGTNAPNNGGITIAGFTAGQRYQYSAGATFVSGSATPASITAIPAGGVITSGLANITQQYTVRIYDATTDNCYIDKVISITAVSCCTAPNAGADITMCLPKTTLNLTDAVAGTQWVAGTSNPATATINATTGEITGLTVVGTYTFSLQTTADPTCKDDIQVLVTNGDAPIVLCDNGTVSYTLTAPPEITSVIWYTISGTQVDTGNTLVVTSNTLGLSDGTEAYYYVGQSTTLSGCSTELCCPVKFMTQTCCNVPNCGTITIIKN